MVLALLAGGILPLSGKPLSQSQSINFYRDVTSRNLDGLAIRSDGRIIAGPSLQALAGAPVADLWWDLEPRDDSSWLVGSGPEGLVLQVTLAPDGQSYAATPWATTISNHLFVIRQIHDTWFAGGATPEGMVYVWDQGGQELTRVSLPADSVFDLLPSSDGTSLLAATGNPGRIYHIDVDALVKSSPGDDLNLQERGITYYGAIRDRNVRRLAWNQDGQLIAGSSPSGNLYQFAAAGADPVILLDQEKGEVTDLHVAANGDIYAAVVISSAPTSRQAVLTRNVTAKKEEPEKDPKTPASTPPPIIMEPAAIEPFTGRSSLIKLPEGTGLAETVFSRNNLAIYRMAMRGNVMLLAGGDDGEMAGYDTVARRAISFPGSDSAQITDLGTTDDPDQYLVMTNNPAGFSRLDFSAATGRRARTKRINLQTPSQLGALRFKRTRAIQVESINVQLRANRGRDEVEGWTPWTDATLVHGGWVAPDLTGQYVQIELELPADSEAALELDQAELFFLPQNRRPLLQSFRIMAPNFGLIARAEPRKDASSLTLGSMMGSSRSLTNGKGADSQQQALMSSPVLPQPHAQIITWTATDPDGDSLMANFSVRREDAMDWTDIAVGNTRSWVQFDRSILPEGTYFTRLVLAEGPPRAAEDRQTVTFHTDNLVIDRTHPVIDSARIDADTSGVTVHIAGRDEHSRLAGVELIFNNGHQVSLEHPLDGILDGLAEQFAVPVAWGDLGPANAVDIYLEDEGGNRITHRLPLPRQPAGD